MLWQDFLTYIQFTIYWRNLSATAERMAWVRYESHLQSSYPGHGHYNDVIMSAIASQINSLAISFKRLFMRKSKKISKLCVTGLYEGNSPMIGEFPAKRASNAKKFSIWWRHHGIDSMVFITGYVHPRSRSNCSSYEQTFQFNKQYSPICHINGIHAKGWEIRFPNWTRSFADFRH